MSNGPLARVVRTGLAICALTAAACGGGSSSDRMPTAPSEPSPAGSSPPSSQNPPPSAVPPATIQLDGNGHLAGCTARGTSSRCDFQETARNVGPGCATAIRINVRFVAGETQVAAERWSSGSTRVFMPDEQFTYSVNLILPNETFASITGYGRAAEWNTVRCPG